MKFKSFCRRSVVAFIFLQCPVDEKHSMLFQSENPVFTFESAFRFWKFLMWTGPKSYQCIFTETSLLERLMTSCTAYARGPRGDFNSDLLTKLVNNYRSHRAIIEIPKQLFYDNELNECAGDFRWDLTFHITLPCFLQILILSWMAITLSRTQLIITRFRKWIESRRPFLAALWRSMESICTIASK